MVDQNYYFQGKRKVPFFLVKFLMLNFGLIKMLLPVVVVTGDFAGDCGLSTDQPVNWDLQLL
jgi:hypothetical protein